MSRMTSKGQVTIPKRIRDKLGIGPGDDVGFREEGQAVILTHDETANAELRPGENKGERMVRELKEFGERMRREGKIDPHYANMTTDEIMDELRGYSEDKDDPGFQRRP